MDRDELNELVWDVRHKISEMDEEFYKFKLGAPSPPNLSSRYIYLP